MTTEPANDTADPYADLRGVRRIFLVALAIALMAAGAALAVELTHHRATPVAARSLLPVAFSEPGFSDGPLGREQQVVVDSASSERDLHVAGADGTAVYIVVRCDRGRATVSIGGLTSAAACSGRAVGVVRLTLANGGPDLHVTVSRTQAEDWAIGIYR